MSNPVLCCPSWVSFWSEQSEPEGQLIPDVNLKFHLDLILYLRTEPMGIREACVCHFPCIHRQSDSFYNANT